MPIFTDSKLNEQEQNSPHRHSVKGTLHGEEVVYSVLKLEPKHEPELDSSEVDRSHIIAVSNCFGIQVDGTHYTDMQLQPLEAIYMRYGLIGLQAACHCKIDKYISRKKNDPVVQLKKAQHILQILTEITELELGGV
jgi:hypothetical protein